MRPLILVSTINSRHWNTCYLQLLSVQRCQHPPQAESAPLAGDDAGSTPGIDYQFLEQFFSATSGGVPHCFDAISVHPYQQGPPETVVRSYKRLRALLSQYGAARLPVVCSEWGYSTCQHPCQTKELHATTETLQARYLLRSWLCNAASGVATSIFCEKILRQCTK